MPFFVLIFVNENHTISYHGWVPSQADGVTQRDVDAYYHRHSKTRRSHHSVEYDDQQDNEGVDRFE